MNNRLIDEICTNAKLTDYRDIIIILINKIYALNFTFSCRYDSIQSGIDWTNRHIRISLRKDPLNVIWDILHELGHLQSGEKQNINTMDLKRENIAWDNALIELMNHFNLVGFIENFNDYKDFCLKTYENGQK